MSGRGRGKRTGSGPGPGRPPKYPNLNNEDTETNRPGTTGPANNGSGLVDILNQLDSSKRNEMLALVGQYKGRGLLLNDFMVRARELLGERLYNQLARDMSNAAAARGAGILPPSQVQMAQMSGMSGIMPTPGIPHQMRPPMSASQMPMHPMPLIYGNQSNTGNYQYPILQSTTSTIEVDVTKMDTSSLQDVMQYSGVDLKAEAELLYRENDAMSMGSGANSVDHRLKFDYFFNPFKFRAIVQHALQRHFFSNTTDSVNTTNNTTVKVAKPLGITEEAVHLLGIAIQKRLIGILRRLSEISRHRVDYGRGRFKIKIENDPKKQIWLQEKLFIEGIGEEKRRAAVTSAVGAVSSSTAATCTTATTTGNQTLLNPPSLATINAAAAAANKPTASTAPSKSGASNANANGSDDTVKTKLANSTAMAALGVRQKSWMSAASIGQGGGSSNPSSSASSSNQQQSSDQGDEKEPAEVFQQHPLASFYSLPSSTPLTDAELRAQYFNRTIAIVDLIACMETDPHMKRSRLLAVLYEALPRENKENNKEPAGKDNASE